MKLKDPGIADVPLRRSTVSAHWMNLDSSGLTFGQNSVRVPNRKITGDRVVSIHVPVSPSLSGVATFGCTRGVLGEEKSGVAGG